MVRSLLIQLECVLRFLLVLLQRLRSSAALFLALQASCWESSMPAAHLFLRGAVCAAVARTMQEQQLKARQLVLQQQAASAVAAASKTQREV